MTACEGFRFHGRAIPVVAVRPIPILGVHDTHLKQRSLTVRDDRFTPFRIVQSLKTHVGFGSTASNAIKTVKVSEGEGIRTAALCDG